MKVDRRTLLTRAILGIATVALVGTAPAVAGFGWFLGFGVGEAEIQDYRHNPNRVNDDSDTVWTLYGGYQFHKYFAAAAGYVDLGSYHFAGTQFMGYTEDIEIDGWHVFALGIAPVNDWFSVVGSAGLFRWDYEYHSSDGFISSRSLSDDGISPTAGVWAVFDVTGKDTFLVSAGWQTFMDVGDRGTVEHKNDYNSVMVGLTYRGGTK